MKQILYRLSPLLGTFGEGETFRDKLILLPGLFLWIISYIASLLRLTSLSNYLRIKSRPPVDVVIKNRDGRFNCRKMTDDIRLVSQSHEPLLRKYFEEINDGIFVDIGANIGKYTVMVGRQLPTEAKIVAVEPEPFTFNMLKANIELNKLTNVLPVNIAAWNKTEDLQLLVPLNTGVTGSSTLVKKFPGNTIKVRATKMDDVLNDLGIETVNFIKIDAEGAEPEILEGTAKTIAKSRQLKILFESYDRKHLERCSQILQKQGMVISPISASGNFLATK